jgi:hypothetical protein
MGLTNLAEALNGARERLYASRAHATSTSQARFEPASLDLELECRLTPPEAPNDRNDRK